MPATDLPNIVLIGGAGGGKSTVAKWLEQDFSYRRLGFAGVAEAPHKGSPRDWVQRAWGPSAINDREKLIAVANAARSVDPDVWLNSLLREFESHTSLRAVVVDDCRFPNEYWGLKGRGFVTVRIEADPELRESRLKANGKYVEGYLDHEIEHYLDAIEGDYTVDNGGDLEEFYTDLLDVIARERRRR